MVIFRVMTRHVQRITTNLSYIKHEACPFFCRFYCNKINLIRNNTKVEHKIYAILRVVQY